jgi:hypothetical protein
LKERKNDLIERSKNKDSPNVYIFFGIRLLIYFLGFYLIATFELIRQGFSSKKLIKLSHPSLFPEFYLLSSDNYGIHFDDKVTR